MDIDWDSMPHGVLKVELARGLEQRQKRIDELESIGAPAQPEAPRRGRPPKDVSGLSERQKQIAEAEAAS